MKSLLCGVALSAVGLVSCAEAAAVENGHVDVELFADVTAVKPGDTFQLGIRMTIEPGWHVYWRNPGDTGRELAMEWTWPEGFTQGPVQWPAPRKIKSGDSYSYGHEDEALLLIPVTVPTTAPQGTPATFKVRLRWLVCKEACLPGRADLSLDIPIGGDTLPNADRRNILERHKVTQPKPTDGWQFQASLMEGRIVLKVVPPPDIAAEYRDVYFFANSQTVIDHAAPQTLSRNGDGFTLLLKRSPYEEKPPEVLQGVLKFDDSEERSYVVETPVIQN